MDNSWASQNLQVIRTLMERAAVYRRALAPVMIVAGLIGMGGATSPCLARITSPRAFSLLWMSISLLALLASLLLVRRQALQAKEPFWSPPTRRVSQALGPAFSAGLAGGCLWAVFDTQIPWPTMTLAAAWMISYGCGLHAAGFFMVRGIKLFGWFFVLSGCALLFGMFGFASLQETQAAHYAMGAYFGLAHLAYGIYLYFTEKTRNPL
jgi:hypothetical protein